MCKLFRDGKKLVSILMSVLLTMSYFISSSVTSAFAYTDASVGKITYVKAYYDQNKEACDRIAHGMLNVERKIFVDDLDITAKDIYSLIVTVLKMNPQIFYMSNGYSYSYNSNGIVSISPDYIGTAEEIQSMKAVFDNRINEILSLVTDNMTPLQKALIIHDEIVLNCNYDGSKKTAYDAVINNVANCQGYTSAYAYLMSLIGIDCEIVDADDYSHEWVKIRLGENYYNADLTWDDPITDKTGNVDHAFFLLSDEAISNQDSYHNCSKYTYYNADDKRYDDLLMHEIDTKFCYNGKDFYVIDNDGLSKYRKNLLKYNPETENITVLKKISSYWQTGDNKYLIDSFCGLDFYNDALYYNTTDEIFIYDAKTGNTFLYPAPENQTNGCEYYGLIIKNGCIYSSVGNTPNEQLNDITIGNCYENPFGIGEVRTAVISYDREQVKFGDIDNDNEVSIIDVTYVQKNLASLYDNINDAQKIVADVNRDNLISIIDATDIQKYLTS